jgi:hypothetical protein
MLDDFDVAALKAWCGVKNTGQLPSFWALIKLPKGVGSCKRKLNERDEVVGQRDGK